MKKHYTIKTILCLGLIAFAFQNTFSQIRIVEVNPSTNTVKLHNYGSANNPQNIEGYWFCARFGYSQVGSATVVSGSTDLAVGAEVVLILNQTLNTTSSDLGFYDAFDFGSSTSMQDFMQYGAGGIGREGVAVTKGIWTAGTFVDSAPAYEYVGSGAQNGFQFWGELLGINDFNNNLGLNAYPIPTNSILNIELNTRESITYQVFDILGKQVLNGKSKSTENLLKLNVSKLEHGLYIVQISSGSKNETKRFIKN